MKFRTGFGYDVHQLAKGESLILGGVDIEYELGTVAHSDGDVLAHAIADALLGAASLKDIGYHFPDTSSEYKNADSLILLAKVGELIQSKGYRIGNIDATLAMQRPKLMPHIDQMCHNISKVLNIQLDDVSVKATTTEKLGFVGKEEGVEAFASVLIYQKNEL